MLQALDEMVSPGSVLHILCEREPTEMRAALAEFIDLPPLSRQLAAARSAVSLNRTHELAEADDEYSAWLAAAAEVSPADEKTARSSGGSESTATEAEPTPEENCFLQGIEDTVTDSNGNSTRLPRLANLRLSFISGAHTCRKDLEKLPLERFDSVLILATVRTTRVDPSY